MLFGMPTLIEIPTLEECASLCRQLSLQFIELNMNLLQYQLDAIDASHFNEIAKKYDIFYTIHLDENLNVSDFNPYVAKAYCRTAIETIHLAKKLGVPIINMHLSRGVYFSLPDRREFLFNAFKEQYLKSIESFRDMCIDAVGDSNIRICIENCDVFLDFQKEAIEILLASKVFGLTFDIGHDHTAGHANEQYILDRADRLHHMHIHDATDKKNHLALGSGDIDKIKYLSLADEHQCTCVVETKTVAALKQSVKWLRDEGM